MPNWLDTGWQHIWLPYTQMQTASLPQPVIGAEGCRIRLTDGRELIDGIASWWTACHGYKHPHIIDALQRQLNTLPHVMFGGLVHEPALTLAQRLCALTGLDRAFFSDSGSTSVEVALKMALQYWRNVGKPKKNKIIHFRGGYHGDTFGAMSVSSRAGWHAAFDSILIKHYLIDLPLDEYGFAEFEELVSGIHGTVAGLIIEPLVQCAGGFHFHSPDILAEIRRVCRQHEILFIADEVATGFGRTGSLFAFQEAGIQPDILCLGKALTGGTIGLAATLASSDVFNGFLAASADKALMHGPTYMANPLACAAAGASLDLFASEPRLAQVEAIEAQLQRELGALQTLPHVVEVRVKGAIGVVEVKPEWFDALALRSVFLECGVWIRPFGNCIYLMPAFTISSGELTSLTGSIVKVLEN